MSNLRYEDVQDRKGLKRILRVSCLPKRLGICKEVPSLFILLHNLDYCSRDSRHKGCAKAFTVSISKDIVRSIIDILSLKVKKGEWPTR